MSGSGLGLVSGITDAFDKSAQNFQAGGQQQLDYRMFAEQQALEREKWRPQAKLLEMQRLREQEQSDWKRRFRNAMAGI